MWLGRDRALDRSAWVYVGSGERFPWPESRLPVSARDAAPLAARRHGRRTALGCLGSDLRIAADGASAHAKRTAVGANPRGAGRLDERAARAAADGSLPPRLSPECVWIDRGGRLKLLDAPLVPEAPPDAALDSTARAEREETADAQADDPALRACAFFQSLLARLVQGRILPGHAREFVAQAAARPATEETLAWGASNWSRWRTVPPRCAGTIGWRRWPCSACTEQTLYVTVAWLPALAVVGWSDEPNVRAIVLAPLFAFLLPWAIGFWLRGGPAFSLTGVQVCRRNGSPAGRMRCAWRNVWAWAPAMLAHSLLACVVAMFFVDPETGAEIDDLQFDYADGSFKVFLSMVCGWSSLFLLHAVGALVAVVSPRRGLQDLLSGTLLTPK